MTYVAGNKELNFLNPESQKIFRDLVENIEMGVFMADSRNNLFYVNHAFDTTFNIPNRTHVLGRNWMDVLFSCRGEKTKCLALLEKNGCLHDFESTHTLLDHKVTILITANRILNDQGESIGWRGVFINISDRLKLEDRIRIEHDKLEQILGFYQAIAEIAQLNQLTQYIVNQTAQIFGTTRCSLMFLETETNSLYIKDALGVPEEFKTNQRVKIGELASGVIAQKNEAMIVDDIESHELFRRPKRKSYVFRSFMSAPLVCDEKLIGVINVAERKDRFNPIDLKVLETIAQQSAMSIEKALTLDKYQHLAETDSMTGLLNYRGFTKKLDEETGRALRYAQPLSLMMIDVDHFKIYNDNHGHPCGNLLLENLAKLFSVNLRSSEAICRYGGDEFGVILPNTDGEKAVVVGEKLRELVTQKFFVNKISLSVGIAQLKTDKETLIQHADQALYQAKKSGRNCVRLFKND